MNEAEKNKQDIIKALIEVGITNPYAISGILSVISKESGFKYKAESGYQNTNNASIRKIFEKTKALTDAKLSELKRDPESFFNFVYGGRFGNSATEGYKFRGRGPNQLTFKDNYAYYGKLLKLPLVDNPELVNLPANAAKIAAAYFKRQFDLHPALALERYGAKNINDFKDTKTAVNAFYNANAGFDKDTSKAITTGKTKALSEVDQFYKYTTSLLKNPVAKGGLGLLLLGILTIALYKYK